MEFNKFDLNLLRALDALLSERNVTRAAARLHVTQQAMSGALRRLREQTGDPLLVRAGRQLMLTPRAAALAEPVREALRQVEQALRTIPDFSPAESRRRFSVAMSDYAAITLLPAVMAAVSERAPGIGLDVKIIDKAAIDAVEAGEIDLCLMPSDWSLFRDWKPRNVVSTPLYGDDFVCVTGRANTLVGENIDEEAYLAMSHASWRIGDGVLSVVEAAWRELGIRPRVAATATSFAGMIFMVCESNLIATVQRRLAAQFGRMLPIRAIECPIRIAPLEASMSWHRSKESDPAHRFLRDVFADAVPKENKPPL